MTRAGRPREPRETVVERDGILLLTIAGFTVYRTSQGFRAEPGGTRMTPGLPDVLAFRQGKLLFWEAKTAAGLADYRKWSTHTGTVPASAVKRWKRAQAQHLFRERVQRVGPPIYHVIGTVMDLHAALTILDRTKEQE